MNPPTMSRSELVRVLLGNPRLMPAPITALQAGDTEAPYPSSDAHQNRLLERRLLAAREILLRDLRKTLNTNSVFQSPRDLHDWLRLRCAHLEHEIFLVMYLTVQNQMIEIEEVFRGTLTQTSVYPREIVKGALLRNAAAVVLAHNHPSGGTQPSRADESLTHTLRAALALVDVRVLDHFIVAGTQTVSFAERGLI
ncbi:DNA repair protein RadC [Comamonadaceae bacterium G21597-S1]|nr:DNA repair protein RadC [Comamonadaceae bacterium G21597-S1]